MVSCQKVNPEQNSQKLCVLILLVSGQRGQVLKALKISNMIASPKNYKFQLSNVDLKQGRRGYRPEALELKAFPADKRLCVHHYLTSYLKRTLDIRGSEQQLILTTRAPHKGTSQDTMSRWYGWPKWTKSAKGSTYEKFHVRKHTRIKSFVYKTIRVSKVSCIKWYAYQKLRERFHTCMFKDQSKLPIPYMYVFIRVTFNTRCFYYV